jgi:hypothetical protein
MHRPRIQRDLASLIAGSAASSVTELPISPALCLSDSIAPASPQRSLSPIKVIDQSYSKGR